MAHFDSYRSHCSADSVASSNSCAHISLGLHASGDSQVTITDSDDMFKWHEHFAKLNPFHETDAEKALSAPDATRASTEVGVASCPGRIDFQTDAMPMSTEADEVAAWAEQYVRKDPVQDMPSAVETLEITTATESASTPEAPLAPAAATVDAAPCQHVSFSPAVLAVSYLPAVILVQPVHVPVFVPVATAPPAASLPNSSQARRRDRSRSTVPTRGPQTRNSLQDNATTATEALAGSEAEWIERARKRLHGLNELRASDIYCNNQHISRWQRPSSPNPYDRTIPKRRWEASLAECRVGCRQIHADAMRQLMGMGFQNEHANKIALRRASGNVNEAVHILLSS